MAERSSRYISLSETLPLWSLGYIVDGAAKIRHAKYRGIAALQHLDTFKRVRFLANTAKRTPQRKAIPISGGIKTTNFEEIKSIVRAIEIG
ncbi:hypothetical protein D9M69_538080 [compost metagenome]